MTPPRFRAFVRVQPRPYDPAMIERVAAALAREPGDTWREICARLGLLPQGRAGVSIALAALAWQGRAARRFDGRVWRWWRPM